MYWEDDCKKADTELRELLEWPLGKLRPQVAAAVNWLCEWTNNEQVSIEPLHERATKVERGKLDCISVTVINAWFALDGLRQLYILDSPDEPILDAALEAIEKLIPWIKFES